MKRRVVLYEMMQTELHTTLFYTERPTSYEEGVNSGAWPRALGWYPDPVTQRRRPVSVVGRRVHV